MSDTSPLGLAQGGAGLIHNIIYMEQTTKPITSEQRRMLSKLYEKQISARISDANQRRNEKQKAFEQGLVESEMKEWADKIKKVAKLEEEAGRLKKEIEKGVEGTNFRFKTWSGLEIDVENTHPKMREFEKESRNLSRKMSEAQDKIMMDIWGLTGDYNAILEAIEKEFKAIGV
jgi:hypothetical protein